MRKVLLFFIVMIADVSGLHALALIKSKTVAPHVEISASYGNYDISELSSQTGFPIDIYSFSQSGPWHLYVNLHAGKLDQTFRFNLCQNEHPHLQAVMKGYYPLVDLLKVYYGYPQECSPNQKVAYLVYNDPYDSTKQIILCPDQVIV